MMKLNIALLAALIVALSAGAPAEAYKLVPGGVCPKDPRVQCQIVCDNGQTADYMKWTGSGWSDLVGRVKDPDMNGEAKKLIANENKMNSMMGGAPDCK